MPIQFTTDGVPGSRRLALWQDIVCDVYVQLDCKSDLGSAFAGSVTRARLGQATCSEVSSQRQHVFRKPPAPIPLCASGQVHPCVVPEIEKILQRRNRQRRDG